MTDDKIQLCRSLEDKYRKDEAISLKCAEFRRVGKACAEWQELWLAAAQKVHWCRGKRAYAYKQARMWERRHSIAQERYKHAVRDGVDLAQLDHTRVR